MNRLFYFNVLHVTLLTESSLNRNILANCPKDFRFTFLNTAEIIDYARDPSLDMDELFLNEAFLKGDRCYAALNGDDLASYGWYSNKPTLIENDLMITYDRKYIYMYKGFTREKYRGLRLHGIGKAKALVRFCGWGYGGIISYVEFTNFDSRKSVYRIGARRAGTLWIVKIGGRYFIHSSGECDRYRVSLKGVCSWICDQPDL
ncbi:MAG: GNAT family acetyltransferase [Syntrophales bacterium]